MKSSKVIVTIIAVVIFFIIFAVVSTAKATSDFKVLFTILGFIILGGFLGAMRKIWRKNE